ncbi:AMP-binding protein [Sphingomonas bacterium]|uniref:AMP-binding protein n=1 Tax=Sphingomonas bacterium TaxID=1895847 RepID=UPI001575C18E|nr:AMP-binding protein [Sphingomonas bacterium]
MSVAVFTGGNTVTGVLREAANAQPDSIFLDFQGNLFTYGETLNAAQRLAAGLIVLGVEPGDRVVSVLDNNFQAVVAWFGINLAGAVSVPVNTAYKGEFLRHQIADAGARIVIAEEDYAARVAAVAVDLPALTVLVHRGAAPADTPNSLDVESLENVMGPQAGHPLPDLTPSDLAMLIYTSGTTGPSKGCMISHGYACNLARQAIMCGDRRPDDIYWSALPLFHMNATATGLLSTAMLGGRSVVYPRFSLSGFWPDILRSGATSIGLLGSMHPLIAEAPDSEESKKCFGQIRVVGAAPFPKDLQDKWRTRFGVEIMGAGGYGLTEAAMVTTGPLATRLDPNSSGPIAEDFDVIIADDDGDPVAHGQAGEVLIRPKRSNVMFSGYWNRPADTLKAIKDLWFHSGDIGKFGSNGEFYFVDRKKDYLRRRGENISSFEMEATFQNHPDIMDVAVHAVFSDMGEDDVKVTCVLREGADLTEQALCLWAIDRVPYFAVPRYIEFRDDLPRNPTGKVLKYRLREDGCTPQTWDREKHHVALARR